VVQGEVAVCRMPPPIKKVFDIAGFTPFFRAFDTREQAVAALAG
jgi:anti-anti-sigma regulatory factor